MRRRRESRSSQPGHRRNRSPVLAAPPLGEIHAWAAAIPPPRARRNCAASRPWGVGSNKSGRRHHNIRCRRDAEARPRCPRRCPRVPGGVQRDSGRPGPHRAQGPLAHGRSTERRDRRGRRIVSATACRSRMSAPTGRARTHGSDRRHRSRRSDFAAASRTAPGGRSGYSGPVTSRPSRQWPQLLWPASRDRAARLRIAAARVRQGSGLGGGYLGPSGGTDPPTKSDQDPWSPQKPPAGEQPRAPLSALRPALRPG